MDDPGQPLTTLDNTGQPQTTGENLMGTPVETVVLPWVVNPYINVSENFNFELMKNDVTCRKWAALAAASSKSFPVGVSWMSSWYLSKCRDRKYSLPHEPVELCEHVLLIRSIEPL